MIILGIETSCDETSFCILKGKEILAMKTFSQISLHAQYGGVVPEIASRSHLEQITIVANEVFAIAKLKPKDINLIAVTSEPGLIGSLLVGINFAKGLSLSTGIPIMFVNHLEGHIFTCSLTHDISKEFYCLLVSGGHTQTIEVEDISNYKIIGQTIDDSVGEGFDKLAKSLGLAYPGGPIIESLAKKGDENRFKTGIPLKGKNKFDFSFSGIKTHFLNLVLKHKNEQDIYDICASFQKTVCNILLDRTKNMIEVSSKNYRNLVICGGVSANNYIRERFEKEIPNLTICYAPLNLCTDNGAMIANIGRVKSLV